MDLREYLFRKNMSNVEFAALINYTPSYVGEIKNGRKVPGKKLTKIIEQVTGGEVTFNKKLEENDGGN